MPDFSNHPNGRGIKVVVVAGARPNFIKLAALHKAFIRFPDINSIIVHTGQHHSTYMSDVFFEQLELPAPVYNLNTNSTTTIRQIADIMTAFEPIVEEEKPDVIIVFGDVNSTLACALVANKLNIRLAHVEAGLRSGDPSMPEETNRKLTDAISDYLFVSEASGLQNLADEGVSANRVFYVGNCMIDTLLHFRAQASALQTPQTLGLAKGNYILITFHRPSNVDQFTALQKLTELIIALAQYLPVVFPIHPRTSNQLKKFGLLQQLQHNSDVILSDPLGYLPFLNLIMHAKMVVTDSGGLQEETTCLNVPCITFRDTTERPATIEWGTNALAADLKIETVVDLALKVVTGQWKEGRTPPLWDGAAGTRIAHILHDLIHH